MADQKISELVAAAELVANDLFIITDIGTTTSQSVTATQILGFVQDNISIPTSVGDITGLQAALDGKSGVDHTHVISQVIGLQNVLDTKYDASNAGIVNSTVIIGPNSIDVVGLINEAVADITGVVPTDPRVPNNVTAGNRLVFTSTDGSIGEETPQQFKADLELNNVDNTADLNKPISSATQDALDDKVDTTTYTAGQAAQDLLISANTDKVGITTDQATAISANTAKISYPASASNKLASIETGADATDTTNVWSSLGISTSGRTSWVLSERGVFVPLTATVAEDQLLFSIIVAQSTVVPGGGQVEIELQGVAGTTIDLSVTSVNPAGWIDSSYFNEQEVTLGDDGTYTTFIVIPTNLGPSRSFIVSGVPVGSAEAPQTSNVITQSPADELLTSVSISQTVFTSESEVETVTVVGAIGTQFNLSVVNTDPLGWITGGTLGATTGTIGSSGVFSTIITIPAAVGVSSTRSFRIRATNINNGDDFVNSPLISQVHTETNTSGNLTAGTNAIYSTPNLDISVTVQAGDAPFTAVLNQHATDNTSNPIQTLNFSNLNELQSFDTIDLSSVADGLTNYYVHISDQDGDMVVETEPIDVQNEAPTANIVLTSGSDTPSGLSPTVLTCNFSDPEGDSVGFQWTVDNVNVSGQTGGTINIAIDADTGTVNHGTGEYRCVVTAITGNTTPVTTNAIAIFGTDFLFDQDGNILTDGTNNLTS